MKRSLLILLPILMLLGCDEKSEYLYSDGGDAITFSVSSNSPMSRAIVESEADLASVGLYGYRLDVGKRWPSGYSASTHVIMANERLDYVGDDQLWAYHSGASFYWDYKDPSDLFSFFGVAPYDAKYSDDVTVDSTTGLTLAYEVEDPTNDLMLADVTNMSRSMGGVVTLNFEHAMAALTLDTDYSKISKVTLSGELITAGDVTVASSCVWSTDDSTQEAVTYTWWDATVNYDTDSSVAETTHLMVIPQAITDGQLKMTISYNDGKTDPKEVSLPAMSYTSGTVYTFSYTNSYFEFEEDEEAGTVKLYIDLDDFDSYLYDAGSNVNEQMLFLEEYFGNLNYTSDDVTVVIKGDYQYYKLINYIAQSGVFKHFDLSEVEIDSNTWFDYETFKGNEYVESVIMPAIFNDTNFYDNLFNECTSLKSVTFPSTVEITEIPMKVFLICPSLIYVNIPTTVTSIGWSAFENCSSLAGYNEDTGEGIYFEEGRTEVVTLNPYAFYGTQVTSEDMPDGYWGCLSGWENFVFD
ncbi:MAG: fimbrillin family protein [Rikenellaceae bacterium]